MEYDDTNRTRVLKITRLKKQSKDCGKMYLNFTTLNAQCNPARRHSCLFTNFGRVHPTHLFLHALLHCYISLHFALHCTTATAHCVLHSALHLNASGQNCIGFQGTVSMGLTLHLTSKIQLWQRIKKVKEGQYVLSLTILQQILSGKVPRKAHSFRSMFSILFHIHWTQLEEVGESPV